MDLESRDLYYLYSENKGADQLHSYCKADLRLCFCLCRLLVFPCGGSNGLDIRTLVFRRKETDMGKTRIDERAEKRIAKKIKHNARKSWDQ